MSNLTNSGPEQVETSVSPANESPPDTEELAATDPPGNQSPPPSTKSNGPDNQANNLAIGIQFPRRILFLLIAYGLTYPFFSLLRQFAADSVSLSSIQGPGIPNSLDQIDWSISWFFSDPISELINRWLGNTLQLLLAALVLAFLLAILPAIIAVLVDFLEDRMMPLGAIFKWLGRLFIFPLGSLPIVALAFLLLSIFAVELELLPLGGRLNPRDIGVASSVRQGILPTITMALFPAMVAAQVAARKATLPRELTYPRRWLASLLQLVAVLLNQIGGLIGALIIVEIIFGWLGIGGLLMQAFQTRDIPLVFGILRTYAIIILLARLAAELFFWLARLAQDPERLLNVESITSRNKPRIIWSTFAISLLLLPVVIFIIGFSIKPETMLEPNPVNSLSSPSSEYLFGTDRLGRDIQARAMHGAYRTLTTAAIAAVVLVLPGGLIGGLVGHLAKRRTWQFESLADLVLLPFEILLFIPALAAAVVFMLWVPELSATGLGLVITLIMLPRTVQAAKNLWIAAPGYVSNILQVLGGFVTLFLALLYAAFSLTIAVDFIGAGTQPPTPSLGGVIAELRQFLLRSSSPMLLVIVLILACSFPLYLAADSLISFFLSKRAQADLNE